MSACTFVQGYRACESERLHETKMVDAQPPNSRLLTDACNSPLRARYGAAKPERYSAKTALAKMLRIMILFFISTATLAQAQDWLNYVRGLGFRERLAEIRTVSELPKAVQRDRVPALIQLLKDEDQSVRVVAATEIAEIRSVSSVALSQLINNFEQPHGEEGMVYVEVVATFGEQALPPLQQALGSSNWLVRARACDATRKIKPKLYRDGECNHKAP